MKAKLIVLAGFFSAGLLAGQLFAQFEVQPAAGGFPARALATVRNDDPVAAAVAALKEAKDDAARQAAELELRKSLETDYDARLESYEKHLDHLETELAKMRDQLQKRKMAKSAMVDLRLQVLKAEADDLGWPNEINSRNSRANWRVLSSDPFAAQAAAMMFGVPAESPVAPEPAQVPGAMDATSPAFSRPAPSLPGAGGR